MVNRRGPLFGLLALGLVVSVSACGGGSDARPAAARTAPAPSGSASAPATPDVAAFQKFSGLTVPSSATGVSVRVTQGKTEQGMEGDVYHVSFTMPTQQTNAFCADGGMGGQLPATAVPFGLRNVFDYRGASTALATCSASLPGQWDVQRRVLVVGTDQPTATVQVVAFRMPN
jgi:hypothetical protein